MVNILGDLYCCYRLSVLLQNLRMHHGKPKTAFSLNLTVSHIESHNIPTNQLSEFPDELFIRKETDRVLWCFPWLSAPLNIQQDFLDFLFCTFTSLIIHQHHAVLPASLVNGNRLKFLQQSSKSTSCIEAVSLTSRETEISCHLQTTSVSLFPCTVWVKSSLLFANHQNTF